MSHLAGIGIVAPSHTKPFGISTVNVVSGSGEKAILYVSVSITVPSGSFL